MGGFGSGRTAWRPKAEHNRFIDANRLRRSGCMIAGYWGAWVWRRDEQEVARIGIRCDGEALTLDYKIRFSGEREWTSVAERVPIEDVPCRYGGERAYFRCPGIVNGRHCGRRVVKLFGAGRNFVCRHCYRIAYASQSETHLDRLYRKANKLRMALGGDPGMASLLPGRPKGMWRRTWERHLEKICETEEEADLEFEVRASRLLDRLDPTWRERHR